MTRRQILTAASGFVAGVGIFIAAVGIAIHDMIKIEEELMREDLL